MSAIQLDGVLDEPEWVDAQHFTDMKLVEPYVLTNPEYKTEIFVTSNEYGLYFGIKNYQPIATRNNDISARDRGIGSDKIQILIDFDNNAITAYSFEVGSGGSIRDGIVSNENNFSNEWDGNWSAKTASTDDYWITEVLIPWDVVSMKQSQDDQREIRWHVNRTIADQNQQYGNVAININRQRFLSDFAIMTVADFASSSFQLFGYGIVRNDFHINENSTDAGLDLFWKSGNGKQLTATFNPNFGHVESDGLVVNFSATETFFNERRPFFTENQALFDVRGANGLRILHTRRIGASPDSGDEVTSDIDAALKFTDNRDNLTYGLFAATEASGDVYQGRNYFASRFLHKTDKHTLGFIGTYADRVDINRTAFTYAIDHEYRWNSQTILQSQLISTDTAQDFNDEQTQARDWGGRFQIQQQISENRNHTFDISHYGKNFEINDFGYLPRNNINTGSYEHTLKVNDYSEESFFQQREYEFNVEHRRNNQDDILGTFYEFSDKWYFKDSSSFNWDLSLNSSGINDLISRNNGLVNVDSGYSFRIRYDSSNANKLRYHGFIRRTDTFNNGKDVQVHLHPSYFFKDNYNIDLSLTYTDSKDWLNWLDDDLFGRYDRKQLNASLDFNANFSQKQELRFRFQWLAIDAHARDQYQLDEQGNLNNTGENLDDFSLSNTALQIRYRYEIAPLSNIFVVYSRGANIFNETREGLGELFDPGFSNVNSDVFLIKVRYKFF